MSEQGRTFATTSPATPKKGEPNQASKPKQSPPNDGQRTIDNGESRCDNKAEPQDELEHSGTGAPASPSDKVDRQSDESTLSVLINATSDLLEQAAAQSETTTTAGQQQATTIVPASPTCRYRPQKYCAVCGDKAIACNFNAVTCESCKAFFRRNAFKEQRLKCLFDNCCLIDRVTRRFCSKCRLLKCFQIGMKREWILTDEQKQIKRVKIMQNKKCKSSVNQSDEDHDNMTTSNSSSPIKRPQQQVVVNSVRYSGSAASLKNAGNGAIETKDAATSCPEEHERLYCSLASQCQYCSLRLAGNHQYQYHHHHHHRHHQVQVAACTMQHYSPAATGGSLGATSGGQHLLPTANGYPLPQTMVADEQQAVGQNLHQLQRSINNAPRVVGVSRSSSSGSGSPALACCCLETANGLGQQAPQLHVMTPSQAPISVLHLVSPADSMYGGLIGAQHLLPNAGSPGSGDFAQTAATASYPQNFPSQQARESVNSSQSADITLLDGTGFGCQVTTAKQVAPAGQQLSNGDRSTMPEGGELNREDSPLNDSEPANGSARQANDDNESLLISKPAGADCQGVILESTSLLLANGESTSTTGGANQESDEYLTWNDELYRKPAYSESDLRERLQKLEFLESEQILIAEMIEATRFMFETSNEQRCQNSLNEIVQFCDAALRRLIKTVKQINAFRMLNMDDQIILLKAACFKILLLRSTYHYLDDVEGWRDTKGKIMRLDILKEAKKSLVYDRHYELVNKIPEPLRRDRLIMSIMSMALLFDPTVDLKHSKSVSLDNTLYLFTLRKYLILTQPDPLSKYESLVSALKVINSCTEEYNVFFSKDFQPEQITPLLIEIFDISTAN